AGPWGISARGLHPLRLAFDQRLGAPLRKAPAVAIAPEGGQRRFPGSRRPQPRRAFLIYMLMGDFGNEARGQRALPQVVHAPVRGIGDLDPLTRAGEPDIGEAALLLQASGAAVVERALMGEQPLLPPGQEDRVEFQPLGA